MATRIGAEQRSGARAAAGTMTKRARLSGRSLDRAWFPLVGAPVILKQEGSYVHALQRPACNPKAHTHSCKGCAMGCANGELGRHTSTSPQSPPAPDSRPSLAIVQERCLVSLVEY